jgi:hypothetical protein
MALTPGRAQYTAGRYASRRAGIHLVHGAPHANESNPDKILAAARSRDFATRRSLLRSPWGTKALGADGIFEASESSIPLPAVRETLLAERLRGEALGLLVRREAIPPSLAGRMLARRHSGFTAHAPLRVPGGDAEAPKSLAGYMLRTPFSPEKIACDATSGSVIYRSRPRMPPG